MPTIAQYQATEYGSTWNKPASVKYRNTSNSCPQPQTSGTHGGHVDQYGIKRLLWQRYVMQYRQIPSPEVWAEVQRNILRKYVQRGHMGDRVGDSSGLTKRNIQDMAEVKRKHHKTKQNQPNKYISPSPKHK